jgi:SP family arabinose:H+ symporter-like MFS transporter
MLGMETVPALWFIALLFTVPESPRWLIQNNREDEGRQILSRISGSEQAEIEVAAIRAANREEEGTFSELATRQYRRPLLIAAVLMAGSQFCGINAIIYYSSKIFESAGAVKNAAFTSTVWVGLVNLLFTFVAIALVDKAGRRPLLLVGTGIQVIALGLVGWMFKTQQHGLGLLLCIVAFIAAFAMALGPLSWLVCSEIFPNKVRGRAMSIATFIIWSSCYVVAQTFPMLNDSKAIGPALTFWLYGGVSLLTFLFVFMLVPETKGRTLEEIEAFWLADIQQRRSHR